MENHLELCKKNCEEKAEDICCKNSVIEKLEGNFKIAQDKIAATVTELEQRNSDLAALEKKFESATSDIEEKNSTIQVTLKQWLKHSPH